MDLSVYFDRFLVQCLKHWINTALVLTIASFALASRWHPTNAQSTLLFWFARNTHGDLLRTETLKSHARAASAHRADEKWKRKNGDGHSPIFCLPSFVSRFSSARMHGLPRQAASRRVDEPILVCSCSCVTEKSIAASLFKGFFWAGEGPLAYGGVVLGSGLLDLLG